jgi:hypothetical protein
LALRSRYLPSQRSFQPPHLGFAAFDHLLAPNQMAKANHTSAEENNSPSSLRRLPTKKLSIQAVLEVVLVGFSAFSFLSAGEYDYSSHIRSAKL